jgi:hypothetical protein
MEWASTAVKIDCVYHPRQSGKKTTSRGHRCDILRAIVPKHASKKTHRLWSADTFKILRRSEPLALK